MGNLAPGSPFSGRGNRAGLEAAFRPTILHRPAGGNRSGYDRGRRTNVHLREAQVFRTPGDNPPDSWAAHTLLRGLAQTSAF